MDVPLSDFGVGFDFILVFIKRLLAIMGGLIIFFGAIRSLGSFFLEYFKKNAPVGELDLIRLAFGRHISLGLEFIVAADVIETTTAPDYYSIGILAILVALRSFLSYFLNREISALKTTH